MHTFKWFEEWDQLYFEDLTVKTMYFTSMDKIMIPILLISITIVTQVNAVVDVEAELNK